MKFIVIVFGLMLINYNAFSQKKIGVELDAGAAIPMQSDLKDVFDLGLNLKLGIPINVLNKHFYIKPTGGVKWYFKEIENVNSVTEHLRIWKAGIEFQYIIFSNEEVSISPTIGIEYNWLTNYYSATYEDPFSNTSTTETSDKLVKGKAISGELGFVSRFDNIFIKLGYEFLNPQLTIDEGIVTEALDDGLIVDPTPIFNLNSITISIGYTYWFK
jgi:hypothetical protein